MTHREMLLASSMLILLLAPMGACGDEAVTEGSSSDSRVGVASSLPPGGVAPSGTSATPGSGSTRTSSGDSRTSPGDSPSPSGTGSTFGTGVVPPTSTRSSTGGGASRGVSSTPSPAASGSGATPTPAETIPTSSGVADLLVSGLEASQGSEAAHVRVSWSAVSDATAYRVLRDGAVIATQEGLHPSPTEPDFGSPCSSDADCDTSVAWCPEIAWYCGNAAATRPVRGLEANPWGLYDMFGNVWDLVWDSWVEQLPGGSDPRVESQVNSRVMRGGGFSSGPADLRAARRNSENAYFSSGAMGVRFVRSVH